MNPGPHRCLTSSPHKSLHQFGLAVPPKPASAHKASLTWSSGSGSSHSFVHLLLYGGHGGSQRLTNLLKTTVQESEIAWPWLCDSAWVFPVFSGHCGPPVHSCPPAPSLYSLQMYAIFMFLPATAQHLLSKAFGSPINHSDTPAYSLTSELIQGPLLPWAC